MEFNSYVIMSPSLCSRINSAKNLANVWQPHPRAFLRKQEQGWGWPAALYVKRDIQLKLV